MKKILLLAISAGLVALAGCTVHVEPKVNIPPPPKANSVEGCRHWRTKCERHCGDYYADSTPNRLYCFTRCKEEHDRCVENVARLKKEKPRSKDHDDEDDDDEDKQDGEHSHKHKKKKDKDDDALKGVFSSR